MMAFQIQWLGHGGWRVTFGEHTLLVDPFLDESPVAPFRSTELGCNYILVSHGHFDHIADVPSIAKRTSATVLANFEISQWLQEKHQVQQTIGMNLGGQVSLPFGTVKMTTAFHSSQLPDGAYGGNPAGFLVTLGSHKLYFACDTALFHDMELIGQSGLELAVLPIGDLFTMGPDDSLQAVRWLRPRYVLPAHYNTWPPIAQDADAWARRVRQETSAFPIVLQPGGVHDFE